PGLLRDRPRGLPGDGPAQPHRGRLGSCLLLPGGVHGDQPGGLRGGGLARSRGPARERAAGLYRSLLREAVARSPYDPLPRLPGGDRPHRGFVGKLLLLKAVLGAQAGPWGWALIGGLVVTTVISAFVYLRVVRQMVLP